MVDSFRIGVHCSRGVGPHRGGRAENEDNFLIAHQGRARFLEGSVEREVQTSSAAGLMLVVADGMGGHSHGALASATAVRAMMRLYSRGRPRAPGSTLTQFVRSAHSRLRERASSKGATNMGTTLTVLWIIEHQAWWVHVGDSRLYHLRDGAMTQLSRDQVRGEFARRDGRAMPPQPHALSQSFIFGSRGLGHDQNIRLDVGLDTGHLSLQSNDQFLLCSDGLSGAIAPSQMTALLTDPQSPTATTTAHQLARAAMAAGTTDNVTAMVLRVGKVSSAEESTQWNLFEDEPTVPQLRRPANPTTPDSD